MDDNELITKHRATITWLQQTDALTCALYIEEHDTTKAQIDAILRFFDNPSAEVPTMTEYQRQIMGLMLTRNMTYALASKTLGISEVAMADVAQRVLRHMRVKDRFDLPYWFIERVRYLLTQPWVSIGKFVNLPIDVPSYGPVKDYDGLAEFLDAYRKAKQEIRRLTFMVGAHDRELSMLRRTLEVFQQHFGNPPGLERIAPLETDTREVTDGEQAAEAPG